MRDTRLILLEGMPATGKSTNSDLLRIALDQSGKCAKWIHEVAYPHPVLIFAEACMSRDEYDNLIKTHPDAAQTLESVAEFRRSTVGINLTQLERDCPDEINSAAMDAVKAFDAWDFTLDKYEAAALDKWEQFAKAAVDDSDTIYIMDSGVFQASIFVFLWNNAPFERLATFINEIYSFIGDLKPTLLYSYRTDTESAIEFIETDRGASVFESMWNRDKHRPYYRGKPEGANGYKQFLRDYADFANRLFELCGFTKLAVDKSAADWVRCEKQILEFIELEYPLFPDFAPPAGKFVNDELSCTIAIDGTSMLDPEGKRRRLYSKNATDFYVERLPLVLRFVNPGELVVSGAQIDARWTASGAIYKSADNVLIRKIF